MSEKCARWKCDNNRKGDHATCEEHPPLVDHGLNANETVCPECGEEGMGTIHDDMWYCLDDYGYDGCGELHDPYQLADVEKKPRW
jgi:hypothetical protein